MRSVESRVIRPDPHTCMVIREGSLSSRGTCLLDASDRKDGDALVALLTNLIELCGGGGCVVKGKHRYVVILCQNLPTAREGSIKGHAGPAFPHMQACMEIAGYK